LEVVQAIDEALTFQPEVATTYGTLAQVVIVNRMTFEPQPLYQMAAWAARHGIDRLFDLQAAWLDDDRLGAMLEGLADHQITIWETVMQRAVQQFPLEMEWLHADTTSIYFEGTYEAAPGQARGSDGAPPASEDQGRVPVLVKGYNKDGRPHNVQYVLSLITGGRVPVWYRPWDGNQTDDGVYVADLTAVRRMLLAPDNAVLIGDRKLGNEATMVTLGRQGQQFLAAHPWTDTAKAVWGVTWHRLAVGQLSWTPVDYASRNDARKPRARRPVYRVCEVPHTITDAEMGQVYEVRWVFTWSSRKADQDAQQRAKAVAAGEQAMQRIANLLGKYDYTRRATIEARLDTALRKVRAAAYVTYTLEGTEGGRAWRLSWAWRHDVLAEAACFDGVALLCTNVPAWRLGAGAVMVKYKEQANVEQTIDFLKSPVQIRPMWLHRPKRIAGLTLLIMLAVVIAALLEQQVRQWIAHTGQQLQGLMPEGRDNPYPTAKAMLRAFSDYALVIVHDADGHKAVHYPKLRPLQQQIWNILGLLPLPP
jgi:transposase